jgi:AbrB family looped-hinge helix DNA binding protein
MRVQSKITLGGRLLIPSKMRKRLNLPDGSKVILEVYENELRVKPVGEVLTEVRKFFSDKLAGRPSLADELITERRREAKRE